MKSCYKKMKAAIQKPIILRGNKSKIENSNESRSPEGSKLKNSSLDSKMLSTSKDRHARCRESSSHFYPILTRKQIGSAKACSNVQNESSSNIETVRGNIKFLHSQMLYQGYSARALLAKNKGAIKSFSTGAQVSSSRKKSLSEPGSLALAQIRAVPLNISQLRGQLHSRSSYVINTQASNMNSSTLKSNVLKRARSLSPVILEKTACTELISPNLVRSVSNCGPIRNKNKNFEGLRRHRSLIPIRTKLQASSHEEDMDARTSMILYQQEQKKKSSLITNKHNQQNGSSKSASKSKLFLQALVGGMDIQNRARSPGPSPFQIYQEQRAKKSSVLPRQQVQPIPQHFPQKSEPNKFVFQRTLSSNSSVFSDSPQGPRGFMTRQNSGGQSLLFDDDPGIMSEAETASTGFRRGGKARSSLPVVRTPSKTLERPLGLVFLQYRSETKRAILPNEITSIDTVRALFVRSFPKQLTLEYLDTLRSKIYIHDNAKDMFYELEDLRDIRDRSVLRLFEPNVNGNGSVPSWDQEQSYFSEPEFDSDFQHQHIHKTKPTTSKNSYLPSYTSYPIGATLPRGRPCSPLIPHPTAKSVQISNSSTLPPPKPQRNGVPAYSLVNKRSPVAISSSSTMLYSPPRSNSVNDNRSATYTLPHSVYGERGRMGSDIYSNIDGYISSPERQRYISGDDSYYNCPPPPRSGSITPVIIDEEARYRMEHMERQLANLTGLVQKALIPGQAPPRIISNTLPRNIGATNYSLPPGQGPRDYIPSRDFRDDTDKHSSSSSASLPDERQSGPVDKILAHPKFGKEKSVSFSDDQPELSKQYSPLMDGVKRPAKSAIKSSTLPRMSQVTERIVTSQPIKQQMGQMKQPNSNPNSIQQFVNYNSSRELSPEMYNQLRNLQKKAKELKTDVRVLRRNVQAQAHSVRETLRDTFLRFKVVALAGSDQWINHSGDPEKIRLRREEDLYKQEMLKLDKDLTDLEATVEELRSHVINKRTRVNMSDVENMALMLSKSSKSVADLKARFPVLQESLRNQLGSEMDRMVSEERFLKEEPDHLENSLKRCKKLTGTLVTLKRLASVQEQRLPSQESTRSLPSPSPSDKGNVTNSSRGSDASPGYIMVTPNSPGPNNESTLDALLNELSLGQIPCTAQRNRLHAPEPPKRLPSYPSTDDGGGSPVRIHPPLPPKPTKVPPPPPPRSSSKASPHLFFSPGIESGESSESLNSQDENFHNSKDGERLSERHLELLRKQKVLQEQYMRLQNCSTDSSIKISSNGNGSNGKMAQLALSNETDIL